MLWTMETILCFHMITYDYKARKTVQGSVESVLDEYLQHFLAWNCVEFVGVGSPNSCRFKIKNSLSEGIE